MIPRFTRGSIQKRFADRKLALYRAILVNFIYLGELCVNHARSVNTYRDQTGNLRNSIGYVVVYNGKVVKMGFKRSARTSSGKGSGDGITKGVDLAKQLAGDHPTGWALIVVAGMNYALKVESTGKDVLTSAEQLAQTELPLLLADLKIDMANLASLE